MKKLNVLVNMMNHNPIGQKSLEDVVGIFGHQLRALGHKIIWETSNQSFLRAEDGINLIVEGFTPSSTAVITAAKAQGCRFIMLATEEPTEKGFNHGTQPEMVLRQKMFAEAAKSFEAIFYLVPGEYTHRWYNQFAPAAYVELGYAPSLVRQQKVEPDFEFGFYGSLTKRRLNILKKLAKLTNVTNAIKVVADFKDQVDRDNQMMRAKVIVQLRKFDAMGLVSSSRCNTALCLGRPIVAEPHDLSKPWDEVVQFTDSMEHFYNACMMARINWKSMHHAQMTKFKDKFPPELCVGRPFELVGLTGAERVAA